MTELGRLKIDTKFIISYDDTVYTVRWKDTRQELNCSEKELGVLLELFVDMCEYDFIDFCGGYSFGDYDLQK